ncbi:MAG: class II aldolase/adducin family protein, partial [Clostridiaceae bacterium]|nr:class II aldolase/adducin family protein [Clostridiaceae bacterium]
MYEKRSKELEAISQYAGKRIDYVQGGGGNTSVKLNDEFMAVKASGYKLSQITENEGYVVVNYT